MAGAKVKRQLEFSKVKVHRRGRKVRARQNSLLEEAQERLNYKSLKVLIFSKKNVYTYTLLYMYMFLVRPGDLLPAIAEAKSAGGGGGGGGESKVVRILAGAMKQLKHSRLKPDAKLNSDLVSLVKEDPQLFNNPNIIEVSGWSQGNWLPGDAHTPSHNKPNP